MSGRPHVAVRAVVPRAIAVSSSHGSLTSARPIMAGTRSMSSGRARHTVHHPSESGQRVRGTTRRSQPGTRQAERPGPAAERERGIGLHCIANSGHLGQERLGGTQRRHHHTRPSDRRAIRTAGQAHRAGRCPVQDRAPVISANSVQPRHVADRGQPTLDRRRRISRRHIVIIDPTARAVAHGEVTHARAEEQSRIGLSFP